MAESIEISVAAPGKVILFGEHSVVFGQKAVAAALGLYTKLILRSNNTGKITLEFPAVNLQESFDILNVREHFQRNTEKDPVLPSIQTFQEFYSKYGKNNLSEALSNCLITFFHSFSYITSPCSGFTVHIDTDLPVSAGAGSSASYSVVISSAMLLYDIINTNDASRYVLRNGDGEATISDELREIISVRAFECEKIFHGTPSGIDHNVILRGSALEFLKGDCGNKMESIEGSAIKILLVNTKVPKSTKKQVGILREWKAKFPEASDHILSAMGCIAKDGIETLKNLKSCDEMEKNERRLADLIDLNHSLLRSIGVSHSSLEKICEIAKKYGLSAKLTGAGGGGLGFVYLPSHTPSSTINCLKNELTQEEFDVSEAVLGGPGLRIMSLSL